MAVASAAALNQFDDIEHPEEQLPIL